MPDGAAQSPGYIYRMLFNSIEFLFFFLPIAYAVFWSLPSARARYVWLTLSGYVFYGWWDPRFCLLMAFSTAVSYLAGLGFLRYPRPARARLCLVVPITIDLRCSASSSTPKFALGAVARRRAALWAPSSTPASRHHSADRHLVLHVPHDHLHRGHLPRRDHADAQPVRVRRLRVAVLAARRRADRALPPDRGRPASSSATPTARAGCDGGSLVLASASSKKVLIADTLAGVRRPRVRSTARALDRPAPGWRSLGYTFQLYFDFSGYSTWRSGWATCSGCEIPQNFNSPYKADGPVRLLAALAHLAVDAGCATTSTSRSAAIGTGAANTYRNLMMTMLIGGLWHGANWTFVVWGAYHGLLLARLSRFGPCVGPVAGRLVRQRR